MTSIEIPGGWYCDSLATGHWVALVKDQKILTDRSEVPLCPAGNVLFIDMHPDGVQLAGIGHQDDGCWLWNGSEWTRQGTAFGPASVMFDHAGTLRVISEAPAVGFRYFDANNQPISCESTHADPSRGIWAYTEGPNWTIGQGGDGPKGEDPVVLIHNGVRRLVRAGKCRFVKVDQFRDIITIAFVEENEKKSVILTLNESELTNFDLFPHETTPKPTPPPPDDPPEEDPLPEPQIPSRVADVAQIRAAYPTPLGSKHAEFLIEVTRHLGAKLFRKEGGTHVTLPDGTPVSIDIIILENQLDSLGRRGNWWVDILGDGENLAIPGWEAHPNAGEPEKWVSPPEGPQEPPGDPQEPPTGPTGPDPLPELLKALEGILTRVETLEAHIPLVGLAIQDLDQRTSELEKPRKFTATCSEAKLAMKHSHVITIQETK